MKTRGLGIGWVVSAALLAPACSDPGPEPDGAALIRVTPSVEHLAPAGMEVFVIESDGPGDRARPPLSDRQMWPHDTIVLDPCDCSTDACLDSWVDRNLGCDVCVVLYCDDHPAGHLCSDCSAATTNGP